MINESVPLMLKVGNYLIVAILHYLKNGLEELELFYYFKLNRSNNLPAIIYRRNKRLVASSRATFQPNRKKN